MQKSIRIACALLFLCPALALAQVAHNMSLLGNWDNNAFPSLSGVTFNEVYGWEDGAGREYAILGSLTATYFIEVTNPNAPVLRDSVPGTFGGCIHRDFKTYRHYCYGVADEGNSTFQVIDMAYLPDSVHLVFNSSAFFERAHNIFIDTISGRLYTSAANTQINGTLIFDIATNPEIPALIASHNLGNYTHDMYVRGDTAYMNNAGSGLSIFDFSNPTLPNPIGSLTVYPQQGYNHSSWLTDDGNHLAMCDETWGIPVKMVNVSNLQNISISSTLQSHLLGPTQLNSIPHNPLIAGNYLCISYYHDGIQIFDISNPTAPVQHAWYDTDVAATTYSGYKGAWGVYPYLPSGTILGSDIQNGLFVLRAGFPFPHPLIGNAIGQNISCNGLSNGSASYIVQGGTQLPAGGYTYLWSNGATTATVSGLNAGTYTVTATDRHGFTVVDTVIVNNPPAIQLQSTVVGESCPGTADGSISLLVSGSINTNFQWSTGDVVNPLNGLTAGAYACTITSGNACSVVSYWVGNTGPMPLAHAGNDTTVCSDHMQLSGLAQAGTQGLWLNGSGSGNIASPGSAQTQVTNLGPGTNSFVWIVSGNPCTNSDTIEVYVSAAAFTDAGSDTSICGNNLALAGSSPGGGIGTWSASGLAFSNPLDPNATVFGFLPGNHGLVWTVSEQGCASSDTLFVTAMPYATAGFSFGGSGLSVSFLDNSSNTISWEWDFGDGSSSTLQSPNHTYAQSGFYNVCLIASNNCGPDTLCREITVGTVGLGVEVPSAPTLYPNPSTGLVQVNHFGEPCVLEVHDLYGKVLLKHGLDGNPGPFPLNLAGLPDGLYLVSLHASGKSWTGKVSIVR